MLRFVFLLFIPVSHARMTDPTTLSTPPTPLFGTALAMKKGIVNYNNAIATDAKNFKDLIKRSKAFVDNTLLIKEIIKSPHSYSLCLCPNNWGKSMNLDMIKMFFEIEMDKDGNPISPSESFNYRVFANSQIMQDDGTIEMLSHPLYIALEVDTMIAHQGQYPVIHVSFENTTGIDFSEVEDKMKAAVSRAFTAHRYIVHSHDKTINESQFEDSAEYDRMQRFEEILNHNKSFCVAKSLRLLSEVLHSHFKKNVVILIDDYDTPMLNALDVDHFLEEDVRHVSQLMENLLDKTFKNNKHLHVGIAMGMFPFSRLASGVNIQKIHHIIHKNEFLDEYFGFNQKEVLLLMDRYNISDHLTKLIPKWYNGYESKMTRSRFYNTASFVKFLQHREIKPYWETKNEKFIRRVIKTQPKVRFSLLSLLSKQSIFISFPSRNVVTAPDIYYHLRGLLYDEGPSLVREECLFNLYLLAEGYLRELPHSKQAALANYEATYVVSKWLISYYRETYQIKDKHLETTAAEMYKYIKGQLNTTTELEKSLQPLFSESAPVYIDDQNRVGKKDEYQVHAIMNAVALKMQCMTQFKIDIYYTSKVSKSDILAVDAENGGGFIIRVQYQYADDWNVTELPEKYTEFFRQLEVVRTLKYLGLSITPIKSETDTKIKVDITTEGIISNSHIKTSTTTKNINRKVDPTTHMKLHIPKMKIDTIPQVTTADNTYPGIKISSPRSIDTISNTTIISIKTNIDNKVTPFTLDTKVQTDTSIAVQTKFVSKVLLNEKSSRNTKPIDVNGKSKANSTKVNTKPIIVSNLMTFQAKVISSNNMSQQRSKWIGSGLKLFQELRKLWLLRSAVKA